MRRPGLGFGLLVAAIFGSASCRQIVGIEDSPQIDIPTSAGGIEYSTGACAACAQTSCIAESTVCSTRPPCKAYEDCLGTCNGDPKCRAQCTEDNRIGLGSTNEISTLSVCLASNCEPDCNLSCGGVAAYITPPSTAAACEKCLTDDCDVENACARNIDCDDYVRCVLACPTPDCEQACASTHGDGYMLFGRFDALRSSKNCATACAYGNDWSCAGHISPPVPKSRSTAMTFLGIYDRTTVASTMTAVEGAQVTICGAVGNGTDVSCSPSLVPAMATDSHGDATFPAVPIAQSLEGTGLIGYGRIQAAGYLDTYFFWGFPLSESSLTWGPPFTPSLFLDPVAASPQVGTGTVFVVAFDCLGHQAGGVRIRNQFGVDADYYVGDATRPDGIAEYENLAASVYTFSAFAGGATEAYSVVTANVVEGADTLVPLFPNQ